MFQAVFLLVKTMVALVRMRGNSDFSERPKPRQTGQRGTYQTCFHFKLATLTRPADRIETFLLGQQTVVLTTWHGLHFKKLPKLLDLVLPGCRWDPTLPTPNVVVLDRFRDGSAQRLVLQLVSLAIRHRILLLG